MLFFNKHRYLFFTFFIAFFVMTMAFAKEGLYPFGNQQIMIIDSWHQYYPFLQELHHKLQNFDSIFYTWHSGMGSNFLLMIGYYAMSPLNLVSILVPPAFLREYMLFATIFKIALGGTLFAYYLRAIYKRNDLSIVVFGLFYSFSGFFMGYYWDIMWLDAVMLLPLVVVGMHNLMDAGKWRLFSITLAITLISNFYTAYFVCLFVALYFFVLYVQKNQQQGFKNFLKELLKIASTSLLGIGLSAITLIPIILGMGRAYGLKSGNPKTIETYHALLDILNNLLVNIKPTVIDGLPNIQSGMLPLLLCLVYFVLTQVPLKNRISNGILLGFLFISMNINYLNFAWHGFHFPNQVPFRFSFLVSFLIITMSYEAFTHLKTIPSSLFNKIAGISVLYLLLSEKLYTDTFDFKVFYLSIFYVLVYTFIIKVWLNQKITTSLLLVALLTLGMTEYGLNAFKATDTAGNSGRLDYPTQNAAVQEALEQIGSQDPSFYRVEMFPLYSANDPILYRYRGITQFSSTANSKINYFVKDLGLSADPGSNSVKYLPASIPVNSLLSIKYMVSKHDAIAMPNAAYTEIGKFDGVTLLENKYYLPPGFVVDPTIQSLDQSNINPFKVQNSFYINAIGQELQLFKGVPVTSESYQNIERTNLDQEIRYQYKNIDPSRTGRGTLTFNAPNNGQFYAYMLNGSKEVTLNVNGKSRNYETPRGVLMDLGLLNANDTITFDFELGAQATGFFDIALVEFDTGAYERVYNQLKARSLSVDGFTTTSLRGSFTSDIPGYLFVSIPYEPGWKAFINDEPVEPIALKDGFMMVPISEGTSTLRLEYVPAGFTLGLIITIVSLLALFISPLVLRSIKAKMPLPQKV